jgi:hypothetical protein
MPKLQETRMVASTQGIKQICGKRTNLPAKMIRTSLLDGHHIHAPRPQTVRDRSDYCVHSKMGTNLPGKMIGTSLLVPHLLRQPTVVIPPRTWDGWHRTGDQANLLSKEEGESGCSRTQTRLILGRGTHFRQPNISKILCIIILENKLLSLVSLHSFTFILYSTFLKKMFGNPNWEYYKDFIVCTIKLYCLDLKVAVLKSPIL